MEQALERAVDNGVKNLVVQPTHLMHGAEYDELSETVEKYKDKFESVKIARLFSAKLEQMQQLSMQTKKQLQKQSQTKQLRQQTMTALMQ